MSVQTLLWLVEASWLAAEVVWEAVLVVVEGQELASPLDRLPASLAVAEAAVEGVEVEEVVAVEGEVEAAEGVGVEAVEVEALLVVEVPSWAVALQLLLPLCCNGNCNCTAVLAGNPLQCLQRTGSSATCARARSLMLCLHDAAPAIQQPLKLCTPNMRRTNS